LWIRIWITKKKLHAEESRKSAVNQKRLTVNPKIQQSKRRNDLGPHPQLPLGEGEAKASPQVKPGDNCSRLAGLAVKQSLHHSQTLIPVILGE
jgi:hypothetical protein